MNPSCPTLSSLFMATVKNLAFHFEKTDTFQVTIPDLDRWESFLHLGSLLWKVYDGLRVSDAISRFRKARASSVISASQRVPRRSPCEKLVLRSSFRLFVPCMRK